MYETNVDITERYKLMSKAHETNFDIPEKILCKLMDTYFIHVTFIGYTDIAITMLDNCLHCLPIISMYLS